LVLGPDLVSGNDWRRALAFAARFRARSFSNKLLLFDGAGQALVQLVELGLLRRLGVLPCRGHRRCLLPIPPSTGPPWLGDPQVRRNHHGRRRRTTKRAM
jgi:hypothetical protein